MALASAVWLVVFGAFTVMWGKAPHWGCKVNEELIHEIYLGAPSENSTVVCDPDASGPDINGDETLGALAMLLGALIIVFEQGYFPVLSWGLYYPADSFAYKHGVSARGLFYVLSSFPFFSKFPAALAASFLLPTGLVVL